MQSWSRQQMKAAPKRGQAEHDEQVRFFQTLDLNLLTFPYLKWIYAIPNGGQRHVAVAAKLKAEGVKSGVSDICVPIPKGPYNGLYIEMKAGKNTLSANQKEFRDFVISQGYHFIAAWSAIDALTGLQDYLGVTLRGIT